MDAKALEGESQGKVAAGMSQADLALTAEPPQSHRNQQDGIGDTPRLSAHGDVRHRRAAQASAMVRHGGDPAAISRRTDAGFDPDVTTHMDESIELLADDVRSLRA